MVNTPSLFESNFIENMIVISLICPCLMILIFININLRGIRLGPLMKSFGFEYSYEYEKMWLEGETPIKVLGFPCKD